MFARTCGFDSRLAHQKDQTEKSGLFASADKKFQKGYCIFETDVVLYQSCLANTLDQHPGVAKFGIALEWGSRGLEFESQHSDQKPVSRKRYRFFLLSGNRELKASCRAKRGFNPGLGNQGACAGFP